MTPSGRITILHTRVVTGTGGGPDKTVLRSAKYLDPSRYRVEAAYLYPRGDSGIESLIAQAKTQGIAFHAIPERGSLDRRARRDLAALCDRLNVDIWHSHDYKTDALGLILGRSRQSMSRVSTVHGFTRESLRTRFYAGLNGLCLPRYDHVFAVSPPLMTWCAMHGVHPDKLTLLPNAIELADYPMRQDAGQSKREAGVEPGKLDIAIVARLSKEKGVDRAIRLIWRLARRCPEARLHILGDGPERPKLQAMAASLKVNDRIRWWGWQDDTRPALRAMDLALLTSHREGLPNALLEAMALGVPVAATGVGGAPDLLDEGRCGLLLDPDDEASWCEPVTSLLASIDTRQTYIAAARRRIEHRHCFEARMRRLSLCYDVLMRQPHSNPDRCAA